MADYDATNNHSEHNLRIKEDAEIDAKLLRYGPWISGILVVIGISAYWYVNL